MSDSTDNIIPMDNMMEEKISIKKEDNNNIDEIINDLDKDIFFSVSTAKKKTNAVLKKRIEVSMLPIYDKINAAINAGYFMIECVLTADQKNFLTRRNFWVSGIRTDNGKTTYKIRWD